MGRMDPDDLIFPNHPDRIDWVLISFGFSPFVFLPVYYIGVAFGWWR
jgi:hypothetical protein